MGQFTYNENKLNQLVNDTNIVFLQKMYEEEVISKAQFQKMHAYSLVVHEKGFFGRIWDKVWDEKGSHYYRVVKIIGEDKALYDMTKDY